MKQRLWCMVVICLLAAVSMGCHSEKHMDAVSICGEAGSFFTDSGRQIVRNEQARELQEKFAVMSRNEIESITLIDEQEMYWLFHYQENQSTDHYEYFFKEEYYCADDGTVNFELTEENIYEFFRVYLYDEFLLHTEIAVYIEETEEKYYYMYYSINSGTLTHAYTTGVYNELYEVVLVRQVYSIDKKTLEVKYEEDCKGYMKYEYHPSPEPYVVNW